MARDDNTREEVQAIIDAQTSRDKRLNAADYVVTNDQDLGFYTTRSTLCTTTYFYDVRNTQNNQLPYLSGASEMDTGEPVSAFAQSAVG